MNNLETLRKTIRAMWCCACAWERIDPNSSFVAFRPNNPFIPFYNLCVLRLQQAQSATQGTGQRILAQV